MAVRSTTRPKRAAKSVPAKAARLAKKQSAALLVDEELDRYRSMRDFGVTAEPMGEAAVSRTAASRTASGATASGAIVSRARAVGAAEASRGLRFVIQKHAATRLHYDFRLEWNGVLKSWAVTKGPSFYPGDKRLAVRVEDHPLEYGGFEGIIPKGQYGGGAVMVWDRGTWLPHGDAEEGLESGHLTFELHGQKLKGSWALIRMRPRPQNKGKANWLLIKEHDPEEYAEGDTPITESAPESALTGRDMDEIAGDQDRVWNSKDDPAADPVATKPPRTAAAVRGAKAPAKEIQERAEEVREPSRVIQAPGSAPREAFPRFISPQLASQVKSPPAGAGWAHELKREAAMTLKQAEEDDLSALVDDPFVDAPLANDLPEMTDASARAAEKGTTRGSRQPSHLSFREGSTGNSPERYQVRLTHPDKQIDAASKLTKQQLADYYSAVADAMLPHIADRPLSIVRCPQGSTGPCFFQKHLVEGLPPGIDGVMIQSRKGGEPEEYITLSTGEALVGLAQLGVLEIHPWGSTNSDLERPDRMIFDLDPDPSLPWATLAGAALEVRERLKKLGLASFVKSTGGKGLHVVAPIEPHHEWPAAKAFAKSVAQAMAADNPQLYLMTMTKAARKGRIYVDYLRNERGATAIAPYSPRARAGVPVAIPLAWKEMEAAERPVFAVTDFPSWEARLKRDPWAQMLSTWQTLPH